MKECKGHYASGKEHKPHFWATVAGTAAAGSYSSKYYAVA